MINKLIVGRYLDMPKFDNKPLPPTAAMKSREGDWVEHFVEVDGRNYMITESEGSGFLGTTRTSEVVAAETPHQKEHRNFRWLPWIPGKVSYVPIAGTDVLSGPFTGCWSVVFKLGSETYFGHIGTEQDKAHKNTVQVKKAWADAIASGVVVPLRACNPASDDVIGSSFGGVPTIYSACSPSGEISVMVTEKDPKITDSNEKIAKLVKAPISERPDFG